MDVNKTEQLEELVKVAIDATRSPRRERLAAYDAVSKTRGKATWASLGMPDAPAKRAEIEGLIPAVRAVEGDKHSVFIGDELWDGPFDTVAEAEACVEEYFAKEFPPAEAAAEAPKARGGVTSMVTEMLRTDAPYAEIVEKVHAKFPDAGTTARSIASVATGLRKKGEIIPERKRTAAVKPAKTPKVVLADHETALLAVLRGLTADQHSKVVELANSFAPPAAEAEADKALAVA